MQDRPALQHGIPVVNILASVGAAICFVAVITLFLLKFFGKLSSCCANLFGKKAHSQPDENANRYTLLKKKTPPILKYEQLSRNSRLRPLSLSVENLDSYKKAQFEIPGMLTYETIQPMDGSTSGYSTSGLSQAESLDSTMDNKVFIDEYIQPNEREHSIRSTGRKILRSSAFLKRAHSTDDVLNQDRVMPELYETANRRTQGPGSLGKIRFSLQYEDKSKRKLIMSLIDIKDLAFLRGMGEVVELYISAVLLPERDYRFQSKLLTRNTFVKLDETFIFHSRPHNRDFESRTVHLTIMYVERSGKEITYGESRMALLSHEIYSQVPTEISIGIKACSPYHEIGDAQVCLSYYSQQKKLIVMVKVVKYGTSILDNLTGIHIKAHLTRVGGDRLGKKQSVSKSLSKSTTAVEFQEHMSFNLEPENFMLCTLKLNLHGRHKIMRKHMSLGKIRIGDSNRDCSGKVHWKTVMNSEGIGWTMWHVIYGT